MDFGCPACHHPDFVTIKDDHAKDEELFSRVEMRCNNCHRHYIRTYEWEPGFGWRFKSNELIAK